MHQRGYPEDRRTDVQRSKAAADHIGFDFERMAGRVVARFAGEHVIIQDDGSAPMMPDIKIDYVDGRVGYVETWIDVDPRRAMVAGALHKTPTLLTPALGRVWTVRVNGNFKLKNRDHWLPELLAELEDEGNVFEIVTSPENLQGHPSPTVARARALGINSLASRPTVDDETGEIRFVVWETDGRSDVSWGEFLDWIKATLFESNAHMLGNRGKLARAGGDERHAFIGVTYTSAWAAFHALTHDADSLPPEPPELPEEITHLWLMPAQSGDRCLAWHPDAGWFDPSTRWATE